MKVSDVHVSNKRLKKKLHLSYIVDFKDFFLSHGATKVKYSCFEMFFIVIQKITIILHYNATTVYKYGQK